MQSRNASKRRAALTSNAYWGNSRNGNQRILAFRHDSLSRGDRPFSPAPSAKRQPRPPTLTLMNLRRHAHHRDHDACRWESPVRQTQPTGFSRDDQLDRGLASRLFRFSNCSGLGQTPQPSTACVPFWLHQDRAYQTTSAAFYILDCDTALAGLPAMAADHTSPWGRLARYLVARTPIR
jgi:hypothetical protein